MKKFNLILFAIISISIMSCGSEDPIEQSSVSKNDSSNDLKSGGESVENHDLSSDELIDNTNGEIETLSNPGTSKKLSGDGILSTPTLSIANDSTPTITVPSEPKEVEETYDFHKYENLNALLNKFVSSSGKVNYSGIKSNLSSLKTILKEFQDNYPKSTWSKNQKLSYWINAYNIYTIKLIVDNYPTTSITKITAKPWHKKFIKLGGSTISLNHIENEIIRKKFNEPRIHFALNCASKSCPVLLNKAYTPSNLQSKLTSQTKRFLKDSSKNKFGSKEIHISQIFDWYKEDFTKDGTVIDFINKYRTEQLSNQTIKYSEYSWDLNN